MSDRTQTLSVQVGRQEATATGAFLDAFISLSADADSKLAEARPHLEGFRDKLRAALSQPEHQGDDPWLDDLRGVIDRACKAVSKGNSPDAVAAYIWSNVQAHLPAKPPAPVLSNEERKRLEQIAVHVGPGAGFDDDAVFLRNLASLEHQGEEAARPWELSDDLIRDLAHHLEDGSGSDLTYDEAAEWAIALLKWLGTELQPPTGEVERLRERLETEIEERRGWAAEHRDLATQAGNTGTGEEHLAKAERIDENTDRLQALLDPAPSDSQGGQDCEHDFKPIPDSEHVKGNGWLACKRCGKLEPPVDPASTQGEGNSFAEIDIEDFERASRDPRTTALHEAADQHMETLQREGRIDAQGEGGDEEDWPASIVIERKPQDDPIRPLHYSVLDGTQSTDFSNARLYALPAAVPSEPSAEIQFSAEVESEDDELERKGAASALEELAAEFESQADANAQESTSEGTTRFAYNSGKADGLSSGASLAREKAVALKGGEGR